MTKTWSSCRIGQKRGIPLKILNSKVKEKILQTTRKKKLPAKEKKKIQTGIGHVSSAMESESQGQGLCGEKKKKESDIL